METDIYTPERQPSQVVAWLGFGISLAVLIMIWCVNAFIFSHLGSGSVGIASLYMLLIMVGGLLWLFGIIFSIIGLIYAIKSSILKWPSVCGIVFCCLSLISLFAPLIYAGAKVREPTRVVASNYDEMESATEDGVVLYITSMRTLKCYDNRNGEDNSPANIRMYSLSKQHELETWMKINNVDNEANILIETDGDADYSDVVDLLDMLKRMGITNYQLKSDSQKEE